MTLLTHISSLIPISKELEKELTSVSKEISVPRNTILIKKDEHCKDLFFTKKGLMRGYYFDDGKEITYWFAKEAEFATSFYSFITGQPSPETIETLEDCELTKITHSDLQNLYRNFPETERIGRIIQKLITSILKNVF